MRLKEFFDEDFIYKALIISLAVHLLCVGSSMVIPAPLKKTKQIHKVEITTSRFKKEQAVPVPKLKPKAPEPPEKISHQDPLNAAVAILERKVSPDNLKIYDGTTEKNKVFTMAPKKSVSVPLLSSEKINNPSYQNYYSLVRARIRQRAYFNYAEYYAGEVYLTFILKKDGTLKDIKIIEDRSSGGLYLRTIGLKSIKESAPFPPFPQSLAYPELTFNVVISFQVKQ